MFAFYPNPNTKELGEFWSVMYMPEKASLLQTLCPLEKVCPFIGEKQAADL